MSLIDTRLDQLAVFERQDPALAGVVAECRALLKAHEGIDGERYQRERSEELKRARVAAAVETITGQLVRLEAEAARGAEQALERAEADARVASDTNHHAPVDIARLQTASVAEISLILRDAVAAGTARETWAHAEPVLRRLAAKEQREHVIGTGRTAFAAWTTWGPRIKALRLTAPPDRGALADVQAQRKAVIRQHVLGACRVVGLDVLVEHAVKRAVLGERPESVYNVGGNFDKFFRRR